MNLSCSRGDLFKYLKMTKEYQGMSTTQIMKKVIPVFLKNPMLLREICKRLSQTTKESISLAKAGSMSSIAAARNAKKRVLTTIPKTIIETGDFLDFNDLFPAQKGGKIMLNKGTLTKFNYHPRNSELSRHRSLLLAARTIGKNIVIKKLVILSTFTKNKYPDLSKIYKEDVKYLQVNSKRFQ